MDGVGQWMRATAAAMCLWAPTLSAQGGAEPKPAPFPEATRAEMLRLRDGKATIEDLRATVQSETAAGRFESAAWWCELGETNLGGAPNAAAAKKAVGELKREVAKKRAPSTDDRALIAKVGRRVEVLLGQKQFEEARRVHEIATAVAGLVDDAGIARTIDATRKKLEAAGKGDAAHKDADRERAQFKPLEDAARDRILAGLRVIEEQYAVAGCAPGRAAFEATIGAADRGGLIATDTAGSRMRAMRGVARGLERTKRVSMHVASIGAAHLYLDGEPPTSVAGVKVEGGENVGPFELDLLPTDRVVVVVDKPKSGSDARSDAMEEALGLGMYVAGVRVVVDGAVAPHGAWRRIVDGDPKGLKTKIGKLKQVKKLGREVLKKRYGGMGDDEMFGAFDAFLAYHSVDDDMDDLMWYPFIPAVEKIEKTISEEGGSPTWFMAAAKSFAFVFIVSEA